MGVYKNFYRRSGCHTMLQICLYLSRERTEVRWTPELQKLQIEKSWLTVKHAVKIQPPRYISRASKAHLFNTESSRCIFSCQPVADWRDHFSSRAENTGERSINSVIYKSTSFACTPIHLSATWQGIISTDIHRHVIWHAYAAFVVHRFFEKKHLTKLDALLWIKKQRDKWQATPLQFCQVYNLVSAYQRSGVPG